MSNNGNNNTHNRFGDGLSYSKFDLEASAADAATPSAPMVVDVPLAMVQETVDRWAADMPRDHAAQDVIVNVKVTNRVCMCVCIVCVCVLIVCVCVVRARVYVTTKLDQSPR